MKQTTSYLQTHGMSYADAVQAAYARVYSQLEAQTRFLAFMDCFYIIGVVTLLAVPVLLLTRNFRVGGGSTGAH